jgi:hypothetical protein
MASETRHYRAGKMPRRQNLDTVGATAAANKMIPPIQTTSASNMTKRSTDMPLSCRSYSIALPRSVRKKRRVLALLDGGA